MDAASVLLALAAATGQPFPGVTRLVLRRQESTPFVLLEIELVGARVASYQGTSQGQGGNPTESVQLAFSSIRWTYHEQPPRGGSVPPPVHAGWDLIANRPQ